jgi:hypothetical protein
LPTGDWLQNRYATPYSDSSSSREHLQSSFERTSFKRIFQAVIDLAVRLARPVLVGFINALCCCAPYVPVGMNLNRKRRERRFGTLKPQSGASNGLETASSGALARSIQCRIYDRRYEDSIIENCADRTARSLKAYEYARKEQRLIRYTLSLDYLQDAVRKIIYNPTVATIHRARR